MLNSKKRKNPRQWLAGLGGFFITFMGFIMYKKTQLFKYRAPDNGNARKWLKI